MCHNLWFDRRELVSRWLNNCQNEVAPPLHFILLMGELRIQAKQQPGLSPSLLLKRKERMVKILVEECCVWNFPAGGLEEDGRTEEGVE